MVAVVDRSPGVFIVCWVVGGSSSGGRSGRTWQGTLCVEKEAYVHLNRRWKIMYQWIDDPRFSCLPFPHLVALELTVAG